jgi:hypothetical protein
LPFNQAYPQSCGPSERLRNTKTATIGFCIGPILSQTLRRWPVFVASANPGHPGIVAR